MKMLTSASRVVFLLMTIAVITLTFNGKIDPKDFMVLAGMAFVHFFNKSQTVDKNQ